MTKLNITTILENQKQAFINEGPVSQAVRTKRIQTTIDLLIKYQKELTDAMSADFGGRHPGFSLMNDVLGSLSSLKHAREKCGTWMTSEKRAPFSPYDQMGADAWVMYQPKGSVGIIGTWNAPLYTLFAPLAYVFAAGNRAILKPSEVSENTSSVVAKAVAEMFDPLELACIEGDAKFANEFTSQAFDHMVFTGSTAVGKLVMQNAAKNLVPLTLELGGKSPTIIGKTADIDVTAWRISAAKASNNGQLCVNPDITYVPSEKLDAFIAAMKKNTNDIFPSIANNPDITGIINQKHLQRIEGYVGDAKKKGARIEELTESVTDTNNRKRGLRLVINPGKDTQIMQEEIFGPAMIIQIYDDIKQVVADINSRPRPLALYYFGQDTQEQDFVLGHTISGGVSINEAMMHAAMQDAPFGGVGASGMGHYHGKEGFLEFSHIRTVFKAGDIDPRKEWGAVPPYPEWLEGGMQQQLVP